MDKLVDARSYTRSLLRLAMIGDSAGMPRDVPILRPAAPALDASAMKAVRSYRFRPGLRKGRPVAVAISIEVNFRSY